MQRVGDREDQRLEMGYRAYGSPPQSPRGARGSRTDSKQRTRNHASLRVAAIHLAIGWVAGVAPAVPSGEIAGEGGRRPCPRAPDVARPLLCVRAGMKGQTVIIKHHTDRWRRALIAGALAATLLAPGTVRAEAAYDAWRSRGVVTGTECGPWTRVCWDAIRATGHGPLMTMRGDPQRRTWLRAVGDTLRCESNFDPIARGRARGQLGVDRGIAQINSYWWPDIADAQADDPAWAIHWMVEQFVTGHAHWWMCWEGKGS